MKDMLSGLSNKCLNSHSNHLVEAVKTSMDDDSTIQRLDEHLSSDCKYNAFKFSNTSDNDKLTLSSFFTSIRDRARYQACDRSGMYSKETYEFCSMLMYEYVEYKIRHGRNPMNDNALLNHHPMWREQFDHVSEDFLSCLGDDGHDYILHSLQNMEDQLTQVQKWWHVFGRYWLVINRHK